MLKFRVSARELRDISNGILIGKLSTYISNCLVVRLAPEDPVCGRGAALQVIINDLARLLTNKRRKEHVKVTDLIDEAGISSVNQIVARDAISMMWNGLVARTGPLVPVLDALRPATGTRAATSGRLNTPATNNAILVSGVKLWNRFGDQLVGIKTAGALKSFVRKTVIKTIPT